MRVATLLACAVGGALGAVLRFGVGSAIHADLPWATLLVNVVGSLALARLFARPMTDPAAAFWRTGVLGAFTTFSAFSVESVELLGRTPALGAGYMVVSLAAGLGAVRLASRRQHAQVEAGG